MFNPSEETGFRHSKVRQKREGLIQQKVVLGERSKLVSIALCYFASVVKSVKELVTFPQSKLSFIIK